MKNKKYNCPNCGWKGCEIEIEIDPEEESFLCPWCGDWIIDEWWKDELI